MGPIEGAMVRPKHPRRVRGRLTGRPVTAGCHWFEVRSGRGAVVVPEESAEPLPAPHLAW